MRRSSWIGVLSSLIGCAVGRSPDDPSGFTPQASYTTAGEEQGSAESGDVDTSGGSEPIDDPRELFIMDPPPPPLVGGSIVVLDDAVTAAVSDPDRGLVHLVDLVEQQARAVVILGTDAMPWRSAQDPDGALHVVLRGTGEVATIDPIDGALTARRAICSHPRGLAVAPDGEGVLVACASGELMRLPFAIDGVAETFAIVEPDLRDVFVSDGTLYVTRFRSAEVLTLDEAGAIVARTRPPSWVESAAQGATMRASSAWRTVPVPGGGWLMANQGGSDAEIDLEEDTKIPYGGPDPCSALVQSTVTLSAPGGSTRPMGSLDTVALPVDITIDPTGRWAAVVSAATCFEGCGHGWALKVDLQAGAAGVNPPCQSPDPIYSGIDQPDAQIVAIAYAPDGHVLLQQRDPSALLVVVDQETATTIPLEGGSIEDTGHRLFHEIGGAGLTCASCHPEGGDDGLVWNLGAPRHTPSLSVGLAGTAPFHWDGELPDFAALVTEVHEGRMAEMIQTPERAEAFEHWVTGLAAAPVRTMDDMASSGRDLFVQYKCDTCHSGAKTTNNQSMVAGWGDSLQVPSLHAIALHPPYMHDGRAATLADAVRDMLARVMPDQAVDDGEVEQLVAYLQTL
jgi:hypothetical protein